MTTVDAPPLLAWLEAQIAHDERRARSADRGEPWNATNPDAGVDPDGEPYLIYGDFGWVVRGVGVETEDSAQGKAEALHIATWDPARALAECAAKRRILGRHAPVVGGVIRSDARLSDTEWQTVKDRWAEHDNRSVVLVDLDDGMPPRRVAQVIGACSWCTRIWPCPDVLDVAVVYQDREGWQEGWAPT